MKMQGRKSIATILATLLMAITVQAQSYLLQNATIIDGAANVQPRVGSVLVDKGKIKAVYYGVPKIRLGHVEVIDCSGKYITPGIFDAHVHLATVVGNDVHKARRVSDSILNNMVLHGITSVRDMAGDAPYLAACKNDIRNKKIIGPDIFYAAQFAGPEYFKLIGQSGRDGDLGTSAWYRTIDEKTNIQQAVKDAKNEGASGIKIYADLSAAEINTISKAAKQQGLGAWAHAAIFPTKPQTVVEAGVTSMSHANDMAFQQLPGDTLDINNAWGALYSKKFKLDTLVQKKMLQEMLRKHIYLDPTVFHAENNNMASAAIITKLANQTGVRVVTGTDWIYPTHGAVPLQDELKLLISKCGLSNAKVLEAATVNSAAVCGVKDRGRIKKGMRADILILDKNPLTDISALFQPSHVILNGKKIK